MSKNGQKWGLCGVILVEKVGKLGGERGLCGVILVEKVGKLGGFGVTGRKKWGLFEAGARRGGGVHRAREAGRGAPAPFTASLCRNYFSKLFKYS